MRAGGALIKLVKRVFPQLNYRAVSDLVPLLRDRSIAFFLEEDWNLALLAEWNAAKRFNNAIDSQKLKRVFIFSYSRSGTHNFVSRFHYMPSVFCFREHAFESTEDPFQFGVDVARLSPSHYLALSMFREHAFESTEDPFQFGVDVARLSPSHYLALSMFREYGLQEKKGNELEHIFLWNNRFLEHQGQLSHSNFDPSSDKIIFYIRNIFRILYSRDKSSNRAGKPKPRFKIDDAAFEFGLRQHRRKLEEMLKLKANHQDALIFCFHEVFCAQPAKVVRDSCDFLNISENKRANWEKPEKFFSRCFGGKDVPKMKNGKLWCEKKQKYILGTGGKFNPLPYPNLERTMQDDIATFVGPYRYKLAVEILGQELADFWLNDQDYDYRDRDAGYHVMDIIKCSLAT